MRFLTIFAKTMREQVRNPWVLGLSLAFAPLFVYAYWLFFPASGSTTYKVLIVNEDRGTVVSGEPYNAGEATTEFLRAVAYADGNPLLRVETLPSRADAEPLLRDRKALVFVVFPPEFSSVLAAAQAGEPVEPPPLVFGGDLTNPYYPVAAILATSTVDAYVQQATGITWPIEYVEEPLGGSGTRTEFEVYVPGVYVFAIIMLIFTASMTVAREAESGTLRRLQITRLTSAEFLGGITLAMVIIGLIAEGLALGTALALGFRSFGPIWVALLVGGLTALSVVGVGMIVAAFSNSVSQAFVIANFPLGVFMFFTGAIFPISSVTLFEVGGRAIGLYDILPPRHAVMALNKVMTLGASLDAVTYELVALLVLSAVYFAAGVWIFQRRHMRT